VWTVQRGSAENQIVAQVLKVINAAHDQLVRSRKIENGVAVYDIAHRQQIIDRAAWSVNHRARDNNTVGIVLKVADHVRAAVKHKPVGTAAAPKCIIARATFQNVVARAALQAVVTATAHKLIVARAAFKKVRTAVALKRVIAARADQLVIPFAANKFVVAAKSLQQIIASGTLKRVSVSPCEIVTDVVLPSASRA